MMSDSNPQPLSPSPSLALPTHSIVLPSHSIILRRALPADAPQLAKILNNPLNNKHDPAANSSKLSDAAMESAIKRWQPTYSSPLPSRYNLVILSTIPSKRPSTPLPIIGITGFGNIDTFDVDEAAAKGVTEESSVWDEEKGKLVKRVADVGVMIEPEWRGRGYGKECVEICTRFAFERLGVQEVTATMLKENVEMRGLMDGLGWEGVEKDVVSGGKPAVEWQYRMGKKRWKERMKNMEEGIKKEKERLKKEEEKLKKWEERMK